MKTNILKILLLVTSLAGLAGCGENSAFTGDNTPTGGASDPTVTYSLNASALTSVVTVGTSITLTASLTDSNQLPVASAPVTFTVDNGSFTGNVKYTTVYTNADGLAYASLTAPVFVGTGTVTISYSDQSTSLNFNYSAGPAAIISVTASPSLVGISSSSTLTTQVLDQYTNPIANEPMQFVITTKGSVDPILSGGGTGIVATNSSGVATITYTSGTTGGTAAAPVTDVIQVKQYLGGTASATTSITVEAAATTIQSLNLRQELASTTMTVGTTQTLSATVLDSANAPVPNLTVDFVLAGAGLLDNGTVKSQLVSGTTDANGVATVTLEAPVLVNTATITASTGGLSKNISLTFVAAEPATVRLTASPVTVGVSSDSTLTAQVWDQYGNVVQNRSVVFDFVPDDPAAVPPFVGNQSGGYFTPATTTGTANAITNTSGVATVLYTSGAAQGVDSIIATAPVATGTAPTATVPISVTSAATVVSTVTLTTENPGTLMTVNSSQVLTVEVLDSAGQPIPGQDVIFTLVGTGTLDDGAASPTVGKVITVTTDATTGAATYGKATVNLNAPFLVGTATITAETAGVSDNTPITYEPDVAATAQLSSSQTAVGVLENSTLTAKVIDQYGNALVSEPVLFSFLDGSTPAVASNNSGATLSNPTGFAQTDATGVATMVYTSGSTAGQTDTIRVDVTTDATQIGSVPFDTVSINVSSGANALPSQMVISTDSTTILSDNSTVATITVTALDNVNVVVPGATITFASDGGVLSAGSVVTDANGQAIVTLSAGTDKTNQTILVTASTVGATNVQVPVAVTGTTVSITPDRSNLNLGGTAVATLVINADDAGGTGIFNTPVTLSINSASTGAADLSVTSGTTNTLGELTLTLTGTSPGSVRVEATALGVTTYYDFTVTSGATSLVILSPASGTTAPIQPAASTPVSVQVPVGVSSITMVTSLGVWGSSGSNVTTWSGVGGTTVNDSLSSAVIGTATINVADSSNPSTADSINLVFVDQVVDGTSTVSLQAAPSTVAPSTGSSLNTSLLEAHVLNGANGPIAGARVTFSMSNTTGSGEYIDPPVAYTDAYGVARATFYSGSQSTDSTGLVVTATAWQTANPTLAADTSSVSVIVGGTVGSIAIGTSTTISAINDNTAYALPVSVQVTDSGGNAVANTDVTLSIWAQEYALGFFDCNAAEPTVIFEEVLANEDLDKDLVLDVSEDLSGNGILTPESSAAGSLPTIVTTDENGLATFNLVYLKDYAGYLKVALTATSMVQGTETRATKRFWLGWLKSDASACLLKESPFYSHWSSLNASVSPSSTVSPSAAATITAVLKDTDGLAMSFESVSAEFFIAESGSPTLNLNTPPAVVSTTTDINGEATFNYVAGAGTGTDVIKLTYTTPIGVEITSYVPIVVQ